MLVSLRAPRTTALKVEDYTERQGGAREKVWALSKMALETNK
jgi:hypothetical protein